MSINKHRGRCEQKVRHENIFGALAECWRMWRKTSFVRIYRCRAGEQNDGWHYHIGTKKRRREALRKLNERMAHPNFRLKASIEVQQRMEMKKARLEGEAWT